MKLKCLLFERICFSFDILSCFYCTFPVFPKVLSQ